GPRVALGRPMPRKPALLLAAATVAACGDASPTSPIDQEDEAIGAFAPDPGDETLDPADPPTSPDPAASGAALRPLDANGNGGGARCEPRGRRLSPTGLTFVLHISDRKRNAADELQDLVKIRRYLRDRDWFMVDAGGDVIAK